MYHRPRAMWAIVCLLVLSALPAVAQIDLYAVSHPFALPTATTTRLVGMGGFSSCIPDAGFANPAFAGALTRYSAVARKSVTTFDDELRLNSQQGSVAVPLKENREGLQLSGFQLQSNDAALLFGDAPAELSLSEYDLSIHYGRRLSPNWLVGVTLSPIFHNRVEFRAAGAPVSLLRLEAEADWGFRIGTVYQLGDRGWLGAVYDRYNEDVTATGLAVGGGLQQDFRSHEVVAGAAYRITDRILAAVEWQQLGSSGAGTSNEEAGWRIGAEAQLSDQLALRAGSNQGGLSLGFGWTDGDWSANYAYVSDWNEGIFEQPFGGSDTHSFELTRSW